MREKLLQEISEVEVQFDFFGKKIKDVTRFWHREAIVDYLLDKYKIMEKVK